jgi:hypothetical protein
MAWQPSGGYPRSLTGGAGTMHSSSDSNSQVSEARALTDEERALIRWMLGHANGDVAAFVDQLERARVTAGCPCGCASIDLAIDGGAAPTGGLRVLADFLFGDETSLCGAFVFEKEGVLAGLEVYGLAVPAPTALPPIDALRPAGRTP